MTHIFGQGIDLVKILRIKKAISKNKNFKKRIFSINENFLCSKRANKYSCYAMRFAAKEAFTKALGTGISRGIKFNEINIIKDKLGKPNIKLLGITKNSVQKIIKKKFKIFLSISDEDKYAFASVIITI
jgi:holo-[acyl-carrier protein] synthase